MCQLAGKTLLSLIEEVAHTNGKGDEGEGKVPSNAE